MSMAVGMRGIHVRHSLTSGGVCFPPSHWWKETPHWRLSSKCRRLYNTGFYRFLFQGILQDRKGTFHVCYICNTVMTPRPTNDWERKAYSCYLFRILSPSCTARKIQAAYRNVKGDCLYTKWPQNTMQLSHPCSSLIFNSVTPILVGTLESPK